MKIDKLIIKGFKKFENFSMSFNENMSIIVGENESGKSTILQCLDIVLNQSVFKYNSSEYFKYLNSNQVKNFIDNPSIENLPQVSIELFLKECETPHCCYFSGLHYDDSNREIREGIRFTYKIDDDLINLLSVNDFSGFRTIPLEYYKFKWDTFSGVSYNKKLLDMNNIYIDNTSRKNDIYGSYSRKIFNANIEDSNKRFLSFNFNNKINEFKNDNIDLLSLDNKRYIGLDVSKSKLSNLIDIYENDISLQDMGRGRENIIKTELALKDDAFELVIIEEPENNLSHSNTKQLIDFISNYSNEQVIITSHSSMVANRLDLKNIIWIDAQQAYNLNSLSDTTSKYFQKLDNIDILKFILAKKVILVEGAAEYIAIPSIFNKVNGENLLKSGVEIISMGSISYKHYKEIADQLGKKVSVIFDNDGKEENTTKDLNSNNIKLFCGLDLDEWTFEAALYYNNQDFFDEKYKNVKTDAAYKGKEYPKALAHMLKNKTKNAMVIEENVDIIKIPDYIQRAIKWISE